MQALPLSQLGARQSGARTIEFGIFLPWVTPANGQSVTARVIHEKDQFIQAVQSVDVPLTHSVHETYGDYWSGSVDVATPVPGLPAGSRWGQQGRYVYRYEVEDPNHGRIDWVIDPYAREFGVGKQSAVTIGYEPHPWSEAEQGWRVPNQADLVMYEVNLAELAVDLPGAIERLDYLSDLGVNCISLMPVSNVASQVDWGYLPIGYFGVDERFGRRRDFQRLVDEAHQRGIAVIVDAVYGHASRAFFAYQYLYDRLEYHENPFMGPFAEDMFANQGASVDYTRPLAQDFFFTVNQHWLDVFHVDGFRYDCVPNYWRDPMSPGYPNLVYNTWEWVKKQAAGGGYFTRFAAPEGLRLIQCAEFLDNARGVLWQSYSTSAWQDDTLHAAEDVAQGRDGAIDRFGFALGLDGFPTEVSINGEQMSRTALQYIETHDHSRFLTWFGEVQPDEAKLPLFAVADRARWFKVQPYLIALVAAKGIPLLYEAEELGEDYTLPGSGMGRVSLLRPVNWDYFYDDYGRSLVGLVRTLLRVRRTREQLRRGDHHYYFEPDRYQNRGVMLFRRTLGPDMPVVAVNFTDHDVEVPFTFPAGGRWTEELHGLDNLQTVADTAVSITVPSNYGRVWTVD